MNQMFLPKEDSLLKLASAMNWCNHLEHVLIAMPLRSEPEPETRACLEFSMPHGVKVLTSPGITDIAKHRCVLAQKVHRNLNSMLSDVDVICWVDSDQVFSPLALATASQLARMLMRPVSGCYVMRNSSDPNPPIAASALDLDPIGWAWPSAFSVQYGHNLGVPSIWLPRVYTGMGFLAVPRAQFIHHIEKSVWCDETGLGGHHRFPAICWSGPVRTEGDVYTWASEDYAYSELFATANDELHPVLAPLSIGHVRRGARPGERETLWPTPASPLAGTPPELPWGPNGRRAVF